MRYALILGLFLSGCAVTTVSTPDGCATLKVTSSTLLGNTTAQCITDGTNESCVAGGQNAGPLIASIMSALAAGGIIAAASSRPMAVAPPQTCHPATALK